MKKCPFCQIEYNDRIKFCTSCGRALPGGMNAAPNNRQVPPMNTNTGPMPPKNANTGSIPPMGGTPYSQGSGPMPQQAPAAAASGGKSNTALIAIIVGLVVAIIATVIIIFIVMNKGGSSDSDNAGITQSQDSPAGGSGGGGGGAVPVAELTEQPAATAEPSDLPESTTEPGIINGGDDLSDYQTYYDNLDSTFEELIMTGNQQRELIEDGSELGDALEKMDAYNCNMYYNKLKSLEDDAKLHSLDVISDLQEQVTKWRNKSSSKNAVKKAAYIKAETSAEMALDSDKFITARRYYKSCIKKLKAAERAAKRRAEQNNDGMEYYQTLYEDDDTYRYVSQYYLSRSEVRAMTAGQRRYYMNTLHAVYGYQFTNDTIQRFFNYQDWYYPDTYYDPGQQEAIRRDKFDRIAKHNYKLLLGE